MAKKTISLKKLQANRRNAKKSTGPRTAKGKAAVGAAAKFNALKHGAAAATPVLPGEDLAEFRKLLEALERWLEPMGPLEGFLVETIAAGIWRLRRMSRIEIELFSTMTVPAGAVTIPKLMNLPAREIELMAFEATARIYSKETAEKILKLKKLKRPAAPAKGPGRGEPLTASNPAVAFVTADDGSAFEKLARYWTGVERSLYRALHELQRLQAIRGGGASPFLGTPSYPGG